jgi:DNA-directed RNA polymerase specialized sigma24 family protein
MNNKNVITQTDFDTLLTWLDSDRENAGAMYEKIRQGLINFFYFKGCSDGENLADETINRVINKIATLDLSTGYKPITVFYGFASNVFYEELKKKHREVSIETDIALNAEVYNQTKFDCLEKCLRKLSKEDSELAVQYYQKSKKVKTEYRRKLAENIGLSVPAMQVKLFRIRKILRNCIEKCVEKNNL